MPPKSREQRLFGAACLKVTLQQSGTSSSGASIYQDTLRDLDLTDEEVDAYLDKHQEAVENALAKRGVV